MVRIELDSVKKHRNASEWRMIGRASAMGHESVGDGNNIVNLCRKLLDAGFQGYCEVYRNGRLVFGEIPIAVWAAGKALKTQDQPEHLRKN